MPNNDWNTILLSVIMFVSSYGFLLTKRSTRQVIQHFSIKKSAIDISVPIKYALVDLVCPAGSNKMEQHIKNDQIINYLLKENYNRLYFNVTTDNGSQGNVYQYVSLLYSSLWNEAVMQKVFNTEFIVISNALHDSNLIRKEDILSMKELFSVYTNDQKKYHKQLGDKVRVVDIDVINKSVDSALAAGNKIVYFEGDDAVICHHKKVALGGTFDRIHNGHRKLLTYAASICQDCLVVGITSDAMLSAKANAAVIDNFDKRKDNVAQFLNAIKPSLNTELVQLSDPFGPAIVDPLIEAIVVSSETIQGAVKINSIRAEKGLLQLVIYVTLRVDSAILSSSFIRDQQENSL